MKPDWQIVDECMEVFRDKDVDSSYIMNEYGAPWHIAKYLAAKVKDELRAEAMNHDY